MRHSLSLGVFSSLFIAASVSLYSSGNANAAGFQLSENSANGLGRAMAGQAAMPENASILATNPAAMSALTSAQFSAQLSYIDPSIEIRGEMVANIGPTSITLDASEKGVAPGAFVPSVYYVSPINDDWTWGIGSFANYGLASDYSDGYNALHYADESEVISVTINPAVAYQVNSQLSIGFGVNVTYADASIGTSIPQAFGQALGNPALGNLDIIKMSGDDIGYGWNIGVFWTPIDGTDIGLSYRSKTEFTLEGQIESGLGVLNPVLGELYNQGGSVDLDFAAISEIAFNHTLSGGWSVQASAIFTQWSAFDKLEANLENGFDLLLKQEDFENTWRLSAGATYQYSDSVTLRAGYAYDEGAVTFAKRSLSIPDTDRHWLSVGATYQYAKNITIDFAYSYIKGREANVSQPAAIGSVTTQLTATEHAKANVLSIQVNKQF